MIDAQFRMIQFMPSGRFIGVAWNYDHAVLISTRDYPCYTLARNELSSECEKRGVNLKWFDGEYIRQVGSDFIFPMTSEESKNATCNNKCGTDHL